MLKLRAFEMVLILFYMDALRRSIIESIRVTDKFSGVDRLGDSEPRTREGKKMERARAVLVSDGVISQEESNEIHELVDYRNLIGHKVHELTADIGAHSDLLRLDPKTLKSIPVYDYTAAKRAKELKRKVERGMRGKFIMSIGFDELQFHAAERTYLAEIERLKVRVNAGIIKANQVIRDTNQIIRSIPESVTDAAQLYHPGITRENGTLTPLGGRCAFKLFEANASPLAAAYMMRISLRSSKLWFRKWTRSKA